MRQAAGFAGIAGTQQQVRLMYEEGYIEIMNDSNYLLTVTMNTGQMVILPCMAYLFPSPIGGTTLTVSIQVGGGTYSASDQGLTNSVVINEYRKDEIVPSGYPMMLNRSIAKANYTVTSHVSGSVASIASALTLTASPVSSPNYLWLTGFDLDIDQESTQHQVLMTITGLATHFSSLPAFASVLTLNYTYRTQATGAIHDRVRFDQYIPAISQGGSIVLSIPAISGGLARASANLYTTEI